MQKYHNKEVCAMCKKESNIVGAAVVMAIAAMMFFPVIGIAGSLEPPASAVDATGKPVPTKMTPPSWSQKLPAAERFEVVLGGAAVLDKETGLVWEQSPSTSTFPWHEAIGVCAFHEVGGRLGWHLPTIEELASLVDRLGTGPVSLPDGHPFANVQAFLYWSATTDVADARYAWSVRFEHGDVGNYSKAGNFFFAWCVRGGETYDAAY
jgi:hypothetical protein